MAKYIRIPSPNPGSCLGCAIYENIRNHPDLTTGCYKCNVYDSKDLRQYVYGIFVINKLCKLNINIKIL